MASENNNNPATDAENLLCKTNYKVQESAPLVYDYKNAPEHYACYPAQDTKPQHIGIVWKWDNIDEEDFAGAGYFGYRVYRTPVLYRKDEDPCIWLEREGEHQGYTESSGNRTYLIKDRGYFNKGLKVDQKTYKGNSNPCNDPKAKWTLVAHLICEPLNINSGDPPVPVPVGMTSLCDDTTKTCCAEWFNDCTGSFRRKAPEDLAHPQEWSEPFAAEFIEDLSNQIGCCDGDGDESRKFAYVVVPALWQEHPTHMMGVTAWTAEESEPSDCVTGSIDCCKYITAGDIELTASCDLQEYLTVDLMEHVQFHGYSTSEEVIASHFIQYSIEKDESQGIQHWPGCFAPIEDSTMSENEDNDGMFVKKSIDDDFLTQYFDDGEEDPSDPPYVVYDPHGWGIKDWNIVKRQEWENKRISDMLDKIPIPVETPKPIYIESSIVARPTCPIIVTQLAADGENFVLIDQYGTTIQFVFDYSATAVARVLDKVTIPMNGKTTTSQQVTQIISAINNNLVSEKVNKITRQRLRMFAAVNPNNTSCFSLQQIDAGFVKSAWKVVSFAGVTGMADSAWQQYPVRANVLNPLVKTMAMASRAASIGAEVIFANKCCCTRSEADCDGFDKGNPCCGFEYWNYTVFDPTICCYASGTIKVAIPPSPITMLKASAYKCYEGKLGGAKLVWKHDNKICTHRYKIYQVRVDCTTGLPLSEDDEWVHIGTKYSIYDPISGSYWMAEDAINDAGIEGSQYYFNTDPGGTRYNTHLSWGDPNAAGQEPSYGEAYASYRLTQFDAENDTQVVYQMPIDNFPDYNDPFSLMLDPTTCTEDACYLYKVIPCCVSVSGTLVSEDTIIL